MVCRIGVHADEDDGVLDYAGGDAVFVPDPLEEVRDARDVVVGFEKRREPVLGRCAFVDFIDDGADFAGKALEERAQDGFLRRIAVGVRELASIRSRVIRFRLAGDLWAREAGCCYAGEKVEQEHGYGGVRIAMKRVGPRASVQAERKTRRREVGAL